MTDVTYDDLTAGELAAQYLEFRELKDKLRKKFEAKEAVLDAELDEITNRLMVLCNEQDASSIKTEYGTVIRSLKTVSYTHLTLPTIYSV